MESDVNLIKANSLGIFMANVLYMTVGILGYATYGNRVETDFLKVIDVKSVGKGLYIFLNISFTVSTTLTCPIIFFGARNNTMMLIKQIRGGVR